MLYKNRELAASLIVGAAIIVATIVDLQSSFIAGAAVLLVASIASALVLGVFRNHVKLMLGIQIGVICGFAAINWATAGGLSGSLWLLAPVLASNMFFSRCGSCEQGAYIS